MEKCFLIGLQQATSSQSGMKMQNIDQKNGDSGRMMPRT
jgi:hypothetical protein